MVDYRAKYLKYKNKYILLKKQMGGRTIGEIDSDINELGEDIDKLDHREIINLFDLYREKVTALEKELNEYIKTKKESKEIIDSKYVKNIQFKISETNTLSNNLGELLSRMSYGR